MSKYEPLALRDTEHLIDPEQASVNQNVNLKESVEVFGV